MDKTTQFLRLGFFFLMCLGLVLASFFLWEDKLNGGEWVMMCSILFGADRLSNAVTEGFTAYKQPKRVDNGYGKPIE